MAEETLLSDDFLRQLINVGEVDILVGLPTHNNAQTIEPVLRAIQAGILKCFPRERAVIINADGGSHDGTPDLVTGASIDDVRNVLKIRTLRTLHAITTQYAHTPDPALALRTILAAADLLRARACVVVSPTSTTIDPDWLQRLARPVYNDGFDLVSPLYRRQKFEGILMSNLLYPMTRAVYGYRIHEPFASEFAVSGHLASDFLNSETWNEEWARVGTEVSLTVMALTGKYKVCQSFLGTKAHVDRTSSDLVGAMRRTVGTLFASLDRNRPLWSAINDSKSVPLVGTPSDIEEPEPERIDRKRLWEMFATGVRELEPIFRTILSSTTLAELQRIAALDLTQFQYPAGSWATTVYEFAASYHTAVISRDHILQALVPLYRGRMLTFLLENQSSPGNNGEKMEEHVEALCGEFERLKPHLLKLWADRR